MDRIVLDAMARWPDVPAVYGWLRLDRRGRWMLVDRGRPGFDEARDGDGSPITNVQIVEFIGRNYAHDDAGRWYWQNGPQRVFVDLECAPWILRVLGSGTEAGLVTHTGREIGAVHDAWRSDAGDLVLLTDLGAGAVHDLDLASLALEEAAEDAEGMRLTVLGRRFDVRARGADRPEPFVRRPRA